mgnify:CR=1 FL=1
MMSSGTTPTPQGPQGGQSFKRLALVTCLLSPFGGGALKTSSSRNPLPLQKELKIEKVKHKTKKRPAEKSADLLIYFPK